MRLEALLLALSLAAHGAAFKPLKTTTMRGGGPRKISVDVTGVNDLYLVVTFGGDNYDSDQAIWAEPTLHAPDGHTMDFTNAAPHHAQLGWGKLFVNRNQRGRPLQIPGKTYETGFWAHGPSLLHFQIDGQYVRFTAEVGLDRGAGRRGSVEFIVTNVPPKMPTRAVYTKGYGRASAPPKPTPTAPPADKSPHTLNPGSAQALLDHGVEKLVFVRRFALTANHVYTEYLNSRWLPGGGPCVLDLKSGAVRDLVPQFRAGVVNRFDISYGGTKIAFDYKKGPRDGYRIYEVNVDGSGLRQLTFPPEDEAELVRKYGSRGYHHGTDDLHPCYLPDGGIVFSSTRCQYGILCNAGDVYTTKVLYRMDGDGQNMRPLSNSPVSEASPAIMPDGRILYHRWEYVDKAAGNLKCLWSMNPDGTGTAEVYGNTITFPETMIYPRPIPGAPGKIVMLGTSHCCPNNAMGAVITIDTSRDVRSTKTMQFVTPDIHALAHTGFHFANGKGGKLFDYDRHIQPIWDKHCISCHGKDKREAGLDLRGDPKGVYSLSYYNLIKLSRGPKQLLGNRRPRNEDVGSAGIEFTPPYALGALTSPLAAMLSGGRTALRNPKHQAYTVSLTNSHKDVRLSDRELLQITNWLDINCQFHPSYWGRLNAKYEKHPNYRPGVTFEEALLRIVPESIKRAESAAAAG